MKIVKQIFLGVRITLGLVLLLLSAHLDAQTFNYTSGTLNVDVILLNPCSGSTSNGSITFKVNSANGGSAVLVLVAGPNITDFPGANILVGNSFVYTPISPQAGAYDFVIRDVLNNFNINTFGPLPPVTLTNLPVIALSQDLLINNTSCAGPATLTGQIQSTISGGSTILSPGSFNYSWSSGNAFAAWPITGTTNGATPLNLATILGVPGLPGGTYTLTVTDNFSVCSQIRSFLITDPSPSIQTITPSSGNVCFGSNFTLQLNASENAPTNYEVFKNGLATGLIFPGTAASPFNMSFSVAGFVTGDVLTVRAKNGACTPAIMTGSVTLTINIPPSAATLAGTATICSGTSTNLAVTITGGTAPFSFTIDNGVGLVSGYASGSPIAVSPVATTTYNIVGNVTDANGCIVAGSGSATVTVNPGPTSGILSGTTTICNGNSTNLAVAITGGTAPFSFTINNGVGLVSGYASGSPIAVSPVATTTYNIVGNVTDANGCIVAGSGSATVTVNPGPTSGILSGTTTICNGNSTNLAVTIIGGTAPFSFTIDNGVGLVSGYASGSPIAVSPVATTTYNIVGNVTDANGCIVAGSGSATVTVNSPTAAVLSGTTTICSGTSTNLAVTITGGTAPFSFTITDRCCST